MGRTAKEYLAVWDKWIGYSEQNGKHREIVDIYNSHTPLAAGYKLRYTDSWCDATVSAAAIVAGMTDLIGTECGCERHIAIFKQKGIWIEDGSITPKPGYIILYNWGQASQPNDGFADHIGVVKSVDRGVITCIEGNKNDAVGYRMIPIGWGYIRGYAAPRYDDDEIPRSENPYRDAKPTVTGTYLTTGKLNKRPVWIGTCVASKLNVRRWAGTEYMNIQSWPMLAYGNKIDVCDTVNAADGSPWYYIRIANKYFGFVSAKYIKK